MKAARHASPSETAAFRLVLMLCPPRGEWGGNDIFEEEQRPRQERRREKRADAGNPGGAPGGRRTPPAAGPVSD